MNKNKPKSAIKNETANKNRHCKVLLAKSSSLRMTCKLTSICSPTKQTFQPSASPLPREADRSETPRSAKRVTKTYEHQTRCSFQSQDGASTAQTIRCESTTRANSLRGISTSLICKEAGRIIRYKATPMALTFRCSRPQWAPI